MNLITFQLHLHILLVELLISAPASSSEHFGKNYTRVVFTPYINNWAIQPDGTGTMSYMYSLEDIKIMLGKISTKFQDILINGMGVTEKTFQNSWNDTYAICKTAQAVAELNKEIGKLKITVLQLAQAQPSFGLQLKELENALSAAENANSIYHGTIWGICLEYRNKDVQTIDVLMGLIANHKDHAMRNNLKLALRLNNCVKVFSDSEVGLKLIQLAKDLDVIICVYFPNSERNLGPKNASEEAFSNVQIIRSALRLVNPNLEVFLETGWPSYGFASNGLEDPTLTVNNQMEYWTNIGRLSNKFELNVFFNEALDQPRLNNYNIDDPEIPNGRYGYGAHFGLWKKLDNYDKYSIVEKYVYEIEIRNGHETKMIYMTQDWGWIAYVIIGISSVGLIITGLIYYRRMNIYSNREITEMLNEESYPSTSPGGSAHHSALIEETDLKLDYMKILGRGAFGIVFKGYYKETPVAVKMLEGGTTKVYLSTLLSEAKVMVYLNKHPNLVNLIGIVATNLRRGKLKVVLEFCSKGSLLNYLKKQRDIQQPESGIEYKSPSIQLFRWAQQICNAMEFLECKKVIHSDLAARNVLLTENLTAKLSDFGLSRKLYEYTEYIKKSKEPLPWRWMAIESLQRMEFSHKSDVWAFGVTLWEIYSFGNTPYEGILYTTDFSNQLVDGLRLHKPELADQMIFQIMLMCWKSDTTQRPCFSDIKVRLNNMLHVSLETGILPEGYLDLEGDSPENQP